MRECELIDHCGFFAKYSETKSAACQGFLDKYCKGSRMGECQRKAYRIEHGQPPIDDMMPSGHVVAVKTTA